MGAWAYGSMGHFWDLWGTHIIYKLMNLKHCVINISQSSVAFHGCGTKKGMKQVILCFQFFLFNKMHSDWRCIITRPHPILGTSYQHLCRKADSGSWFHVGDSPESRTLYSIISVTFTENESIYYPPNISFILFYRSVLKTASAPFSVAFQIFCGS